MPIPTDFPKRRATRRSAVDGPRPSRPSRYRAQAWVERVEFGALLATLLVISLRYVHSLGIQNAKQETGWIVGAIVFSTVAAMQLFNLLGRLRRRRR